MVCTFDVEGSIPRASCRHAGPGHRGRQIRSDGGRCVGGKDLGQYHLSHRKQQRGVNSGESLPRTWIHISGLMFAAPPTQCDRQRDEALDSEMNQVPAEPEVPLCDVETMSHASSQIAE